ncbi:hypothetical protein GCM10025870_31890 [Agromyces marinus]|uniref:Uncharacterized protein n=1 Tax=Agromyces marinus TaxID=1389020 RepID=A0ABM8H5P6_9MICO|nr:hypothetical protein GCM10025870_31890 [Agromyces marinus]
MRWATAPIPIYPATGSLSSWQLQTAVGLVLDGVGGVPDPLPEGVRRAHGLLAHADALERVHRPERDDDWKAARRTLRFTEAFVLQTALLERRAAARAHEAVARIPAPAACSTGSRRRCRSS